MTLSNAFSILSVTRCTVLLFIANPSIETSSQPLALLETTSSSDLSTNDSSKHRPNDLLCVCGKGGTCLDRSVDIPNIPQGSQECRCEISRGFYKDCDEILDHCATPEVCLNDGKCVRTFGGFVCLCPSPFFGTRCEESDLNIVESVTLMTMPMVFNFIHTTSNKSKELYLAVSSFGSKFQAKVILHDGREMNLIEKDFEASFDLVGLCRRENERFPKVHDAKVCDLLSSLQSHFPKGFYVATITPNYPLRVYDFWNTGRVDNLTLSLTNDGFSVYKSQINFFTPFYGVHDYVNTNPCRHDIVFKGCGLYFNNLRNYRVSDVVQVSVVMKPVRLCKTIREKVGFWRYFPNDSDIYVEQRDNEMNYKKVGAYMKFKPFTFEPGRRWIEYHLKEIGHEKFYGMSNEYVSRGRCSVSIRQGHGELYIVGGDQKTFPCHQDLQLEVASTDPSLLLDSHIVEWECDPKSLLICASVHYPGNTILYENVPCGVHYNFTAKLKGKSAKQSVFVEQNAPEFYVKCLHNCFMNFQRTEYIRVSYFVSVLQDGAPEWEVFVDSVSISVKNRTDRDGLFIPGPLSFFETQRSTTLKIVAKMGRWSSEMILKEVSNHFHGGCVPEPGVVPRFVHFNEKCKGRSGFFTLLLAEKATDWKIIDEPVVESNEMILFDVQVKVSELALFIAEPHWYKPLQLNNSTFKPPQILGSLLNTEIIGLMSIVRAEVDDFLTSADYNDAVSRINAFLYLGYFQMIPENWTDRQQSDMDRLEMAKKLAKSPPSTTFSLLSQQIFAMYRLCKFEYNAPEGEGRRQTLMRYVSLLLKRYIPSFISLTSNEYGLSNWMRGMTIDYIEAIVDLSCHLLMVPFTQLQNQTERVSIDVPYFLFEAKFGGQTVLELLKLLTTTVFPSPLFDDAKVRASKIYTVVFLTDSLEEINREVAPAHDNRIVSSGGGNSSSLYHYNYMMLESQLFWWVGDYSFPLSIISDIVTGSHVDYQTRTRVSFPVNLLNFPNISLTNLKFWDSASFLTANFSPRNSKRLRESTPVKDRSFKVWQLQVPTPSSGILSVFHPKNTRVKIYARVSQFPTYSDVLNSPIFNDTYANFEFHSSDEYSNKIYVAFLPEKNSTSEANSESIYITGLICLSYSDRNWRRDECKVVKSSVDSGNLQCDCPRISWHGVEQLSFNPRVVFADSYAFTLPPSINFIVFANLMAVAICFAGIFAWAHWKDKEDLNLNVFHLVDSPQTEHNFIYVVVVHTGSLFGSGTDSSVGFQLIGQKSRCVPHLFRYRSTVGRLSTGNEDWFLIGSDIHPGPLTEVDIWNDFSGIFLDWYCEGVVVFDLTLMKAYDVSVRQWLSRTDTPGWARFNVESGVADGDLKVDGRRRELVETDGLGRYIANQIRECHHWWSLFFKQKRNIYSHKEKALVLLTFINAVMSTSMIFIESEHQHLDETVATLTEDGINVMAAALVVSYIWHAIGIFLFEMSCTETLTLRPADSKVFYSDRTIVSGGRAPKVHRSPRKRFEKASLGKFVKWVNKNVFAVLFAPSNYYQWFDVEDFRRVSRRKIVTWLWAWRVFNGVTIAGSFIFLASLGFMIRAMVAEEWMILYGMALLSDVIVVDPLRLTLKAIFLFYWKNRRAWDNFNVTTICKIKVKETAKLNYYREFQGTQFNKKKVGRRHRIKRTARLVVSSNRFPVAVVLVTLIALGKMRADFFSKMQMKQIETLKSSFQEPGKSCYFGLQEVRNASQLIEYLIDTLLPNLHQTMRYNGRPLPQPETHMSDDENSSDIWWRNEYRYGWAMDYASKMVGSPIVRQWRVRPFTSRSNRFTRYFNSSGERLTVFNFETRNFARGWTKIEDTEKGKGPWTYDDDYGPESPVWNTVRVRIYGYIKKLSASLGPSERNMSSLYLDNWLDERTRYVSLHLLLFTLQTRAVIFCELRVTVTPDGAYRGEIHIQTINVPPISTYAPWMALAVIVTILASSRVWTISRVRGFKNYSVESSLTNDVLLVWAGLFFLGFCVLRILAYTIAYSYMLQFTRESFIRAFELEKFTYASFFALAGMICCLWTNILPSLLEHTRRPITHDRSFKGVHLFTLSSLLVLISFHKLVQGIDFLLNHSPVVDLLTRAAVRESPRRILSSNEAHVIWLAVGIGVLRLFNMSPFVYAYRKTDELTTPPCHYPGRGRQISSLSKLYHEMRVQETQKTVKRSTWRWFSFSAN